MLVQYNENATFNVQGTEYTIHTQTNNENDQFMFEQAATKS